MLNSKIFFKESTFIAGAASSWQIPQLCLPEFAFVGRSNVGKSTLINAITNRKSLARASQHPGCTKQINFFKIGEELVLVDLPGYGFARISAKQRNALDGLIGAYLKSRINLRRVFVLVDSRHHIKESDLQVMHFLDEFAVEYQIVLTKIDKAIAIGENIENIKKLSSKHAACNPEVIAVSGASKYGIDDIRNVMLKLI